MTSVDLDLLRREADDWLLKQPSNVALCPCEAAYFRHHFCLPMWLVEAVRREQEKA